MKLKHKFETKSKWSPTCFTPESSVQISIGGKRTENVAMVSRGTRRVSQNTRSRNLDTSNPQLDLRESRLFVIIAQKLSLKIAERDWRIKF